MLRDWASSDPRWKVGLMRYFNPVGAHESDLIGEYLRGTPNNMLLFIARVAVGLLPELAIFGNDYPTSDGAGVGGYLHVIKLTKGHLRALEAPQELGWCSRRGLSEMLLDSWK